jgi:outer membrane biosynthesis protein TonB
MKKIAILLIMLSMVACGPAGSTEETAVSPLATQAPEQTEETAVEPTVEEQEETAVSESEPADEPEPTEEPVEEVEETEAPSVSANDLATAFAPATTVEEAAVVREQDWLRGAEDPDVIIIEYGDFQ